MNKNTRKLFADLKSKCNTSEKRKAYNEFIKSFTNKPMDVILDALKEDNGDLYNTNGEKKWIRETEPILNKFLKYNPKVSNEDLVEIVQGEVSELEDKFGKLKGYKELNDQIEKYYEIED